MLSLYFLESALQISFYVFHRTNCVEEEEKKLNDCIGTLYETQDILSNVSQFRHRIRKYFS